jgi:hypothetical protein
VCCERVGKRGGESCDFEVRIKAKEYANTGGDGKGHRHGAACADDQESTEHVLIRRSRAGGKPENQRAGFPHPRNTSSEWLCHFSVRLRGNDDLFSTFPEEVFKLTLAVRYHGGSSMFG